MVGKGNPVLYWWACKLVHWLCNTIWESPQEKLKVEVQYDPAIPHLDTPKGNENRNEIDIYTLMFIVALFTIAKIWKQPKCPSMNEEYINIYINICKYICIYDGIVFSHEK